MLSYDESGNSEEDIVSVPHASKPLHIQMLQTWLQERIIRQIHDGKDLWNRREELFPFLIFCPDAGNNLRELQNGSPLLHQVTERLFTLNDVCKTWQSGNFPLSAIPKASPESHATMSNAEYAAMRKFCCPSENAPITFTFHIRVTPGNWRIYFYPKSAGTIYIGYIGHHLPTVEYPT